MFGRIREAVRILMAKPTEPEDESYYRVILYAENLKCVLNAVLFGGCVYSEKEKNFWGRMSDGKILEIFIGNNFSLIIKEVSKDDAFSRCL